MDRGSIIRGCRPQRALSAPSARPQRALSASPLSPRVLRALLGLAAGLSLLYFTAAARRRPALKVWVLLTFGLIALFAAYPDASTAVARVFGVGRGADFVLYLSNFALLSLTFTLYLGQRDLADQVAQLARAVALSGAEGGLGARPAGGVWVVVPVYNEEEVVEGVLRELVGLGYGVVAVDDGSRDQSAARAAAAGAAVVRHPTNLGQGAALQTGFDFALRRGAAVVVTFDADGQHRAEDLPALLAALDGRDAAGRSVEVALGSRFLSPSSLAAVPRGRALLLRAAVLFTRWVGGVRVSDSHNGLRALRASALGRLRLTQSRMAHASELLHLLRALDLPFAEVPVTVRYTPRSLAKGQSALGALNILTDLFVRRWFG